LKSVPRRKKRGMFIIFRTPARSGYPVFARSRAVPMLLWQEEDVS
jgi:hypothetical protein